MFESMKLFEVLNMWQCLINIYAYPHTHTLISEYVDYLTICEQIMLCIMSCHQL